MRNYEYIHHEDIDGKRSCWVMFKSEVVCSWTPSEPINWHPKSKAVVDSLFHEGVEVNIEECMRAYLERRGRPLVIDVAVDINPIGFTLEKTPKGIDAVMLNNLRVGVYRSADKMIDFDNDFDLVMRIVRTEIKDKLIAGCVDALRSYGQ